MNRNYIDEILDSQGRLPTENIQAYVWEKIIDTSDAFSKLYAIENERCKLELTKYIPISCVASIESYFKWQYKRLIDYGQPFLNNISNFGKIEFNTKYVTAIHQGKVTLGSFIAHTLKANSIEIINKNMTIILGEKFFNALQTRKVRANDSKNNSIKTFYLFEKEGSWDALYNALIWTFKYRNIFCYELASKTEIDFEKIEQSLLATRKFILDTDWLIHDILIDINSAEK